MTRRVLLVVAALLALVAGRFGRRAAMRGLMALGAVELGAGLTRMRSRSDAAAAAAFATGASMEVPALTIPLVAIAGTAAVATRREGDTHDLVVGAAAGAAVALVTRRFWPVAPHESADAPTVSSLDTAGDYSGGRTTIVVNANAGSPLARAAADRIRDGLPDAEVLVVEDPKDIEAALAEAAEAEIIGVCGGDGTVNAAAGIALERAKPLLVLPGGTLNHFALAIGLDTVDDALSAAREGRAVAVDVGTIAGRVFLNVASFGVYTDLVDRRERLERRVGKWPAMVIALTWVLRRATPTEVEIDGTARRLWMAFIGNCRYHPHGFAPSWRERLDDGRLDVRLVDADSPWSRTRLVLAVLTGRLGRSRVYEAKAVERLEVRSLDGPLRIAADGEVCDAPERFCVTKERRALVVVAPGE